MLLLADARCCCSTVDGEMTWNPRAHRWEGNESVLRDFEKVLSSSSRPALITRFSSGTVLQRRNDGTTGSDGKPGALGGARVVGHMFFDPVRMSWFSQHPEGEEELDVDDGVDDSATALWAGGEHGRLKTKASFASEATASAGSADDDDATETSADDILLPSTLGWGPEGAAFWRECQKAERRHADEMRGWARSLATQQAAEEDRSYLWSIRKVL
jgi:hypothetical protein